MIVAAVRRSAGPLDVFSIEITILRFTRVRSEIAETSFGFVIGEPSVASKSFPVLSFEGSLRFFISSAWARSARLKTVGWVVDSEAYVSKTEKLALFF